MNKMIVEQSSQGVYPTSILIDGGGLLHKLHWLTGGAVKDLIDGIERYIRKLIPCSDVYIIFDRYKVNSIKSDARIGTFQRTHQLTLQRNMHGNVQNKENSH